MEVNSDLIELQGLLTSLVKNTGEFSKIRYKGGNEMKINLLVKEFEAYLISKQYMDQRKPNKQFSKELEHVIFFLTINSEFKSTILQEIKEYDHLLNIVPVLSKCLLANLVIELNLSEYYCVALHRLPLELSEELLNEFIPCIKRASPEQSLKHSYIFLVNIIKKLSAVDPSVSKFEDMIQKLWDITSEMLLNLSGVNPEQTQGWHKLRLYEHMGYTLLKLLKLLQHCQTDNYNLQKVIHYLLLGTCVVIKAVTIDVFCTWAEVQYKGQALQIAVGTEAYHVIEKYQKYKPAQELLQMLGSISKKPKTLNEMIQEADIPSIIAKIDECDSNQKHWLRALIITQVFDNKESMKCLHKWAKLCTAEDLTLLLNRSINHKTRDARMLIVKCASFLSEADLILVIKKFYHQHGLKSHLDSENVQDQLVPVLNKLQKGENTIARKEILLLVLQNPQSVLTHMYSESIKSQVLLSNLTDVFIAIADIIQIECAAIKTLEKVMENLKPNAENVANYEKMCRILIDTSFSGYKLVHRLAKNYAEICLRDEHYDDLKYALPLYNAVTNRTCKEQFATLFAMALSILEKCRWKFFEFSNIKVDLCEKCVDIVLDYIKFCDEHKILQAESVQIITADHYLNKYYISKLHSESDVNFFNYAFPTFNVENHAEGVCYLIKLLPICILKEWFYISEYLQNYCGTAKFLELLSDALILMCQVAKRQQNNETNCGSNCLKYCVQNYGMVMKSIVLPLKNMEIDMQVAKSVCRLLREIPDDVRKVEGMSLASLLTQESLKSLVADRSFVCLLVAIGDSNISQSIAKRMLS